jgi:hypothetical protein
VDTSAKSARSEPGDPDARRVKPGGEDCGDCAQGQTISGKDPRTRAPFVIALSFESRVPRSSFRFADLPAPTPSWGHSSFSPHAPALKQKLKPHLQRRGIFWTNSVLSVYTELTVSEEGS